MIFVSALTYDLGIVKEIYEWHFEFFFVIPFFLANQHTLNKFLLKLFVDVIYTELIKGVGSLCSTL